MPLRKLLAWSHLQTITPTEVKEGT